MNQFLVRRRAPPAPSTARQPDCWLGTFHDGQDDATRRAGPVGLIHFAAASICFSTTTLDTRNQHLAADDRGRRSRLALRAEIGRTAGSLAAACGRHYA